jgi:hypothetical protein
VRDRRHHAAAAARAGAPDQDGVAAAVLAEAHAEAVHEHHVARRSAARQRCHVSLVQLVRGRHHVAHRDGHGHGRERAQERAPQHRGLRALSVRPQANDLDAIAA